MKRLIYAALIFTVGLAAAAEKADVGVLYFAFHQEDRPTKGFIYAIDQMVVTQKVEGGYLMEPDSISGDVETIAAMTPLFLKDWRKRARGERLTGWVEPIGTYHYQALDGFEVSTWAFRIVEKKEPNLNKGQD